MGLHEDAEEEESEQENGSAEIKDTAIDDAAFDSDLVTHMDRCWKANCENAERLNKKIGLLVSALAVLFGLGLYRIEWLVDAKQVSRVQPEWLVWPLKSILAISLICFGRGLYLALKGVRAGGPRPSACDLLPFPREIVKCPPLTDRETRAQVFYRLDKAVTELSTQNSEKSARIIACEKWFIWGLTLVLAILVIYTFVSVPPMFRLNEDNHAAERSNEIQRPRDSTTRATS